MNSDRQFCVHMLASGIGGTLYIGVTSDLVRRVYEHKTKAAEGFTRNHRVDRLAYFEQFATAEAAIQREKQLEKCNRAWKVRLIEENNPDWVDLVPSIAGA